MIKVKVISVVSIFALLGLILLQQLLLNYDIYNSITEVFVIIDKVQLIKIFVLATGFAILMLIFCTYMLLQFPQLSITVLKRSFSKNVNSLISNIFKIYQSIGATDMGDSAFTQTIALGVSITAINIIHIIIQYFLDQLKEDIQLIAIQQDKESFVLKKQVKVNFYLLAKSIIASFIMQFFIIKQFELSLNMLSNFDATQIYLRGSTFVFWDLIFNLFILIIKYLNSLSYYTNTAKLQEKQFIGLLIIFVCQLSQLIYYMLIFINTLSQIYRSKDIIGNSIQIDMKTKKLLQALLFSEILDFIQNIRELNKSFQQLVLNYKTIRNLDDFPIPTYEQLYDCSEQEVNANVEYYVGEAICTICMDTMNLIVEPQSVRILQCEHCYHTSCIRKWLVQGNSTCPVCNKEVFANIEENQKLAEQQEEELNMRINEIQSFGENEEQSSESLEQQSSYSSASHLTNDYNISPILLHDQELNIQQEIVQQPIRKKQRSKLSQKIKQDITINRQLFQLLIDNPDLELNFQDPQLNLQPEQKQQKQICSIPIIIDENQQDLNLEQFLQAIDVSVNQYKTDLTCKQYLYDNPDIELELLQLKRINKTYE